MATADRIAIPIIRHDLAKGQRVQWVKNRACRAKIKRRGVEGDENLPVDLASRKEIESGQAFYLHLLQVWMVQQRDIVNAQAPGPRKI